MSESSTIKKEITKYIEDALSVKGKNKIEDSNKTIAQYDVGKDVTLRLIYNKNREVAEIEFNHSSGIYYFAFVFPNEPMTEKFKNIVDHIENINEMYEQYIVSNIEIKDYYLIGDELVGVGSNNSTVLFSFKSGFLEKMKMD